MEKTHKVVQVCSVCAGEGKIVAPHCNICEQEVEEAWWDEARDFLPCGHEVASLVEWRQCEACAGNGRITHTLSPAEWQARQRRRALRWVFILLLCVGATAVLTLAIIREPGYLCGSPWYSLIIFAILLNSQFRSFP